MTQLIRTLSFAVSLLALSVAGRFASATELRVVGGLAGVNQYKHIEEPFWQNELPRLSKGQLSAKISPFDRSGLKAQEMLQLMRLGIVEFGTTILSVADPEDPQLNAIDLSGLNPDIGSLKRSVTAYRPTLERILKERYNVVLLAVYAYPAQVLFCTNAFSGLGDLAGRKVRTSSVSQSDLFTSLGAIPTVVPFAEVPDAVRRKVVDCAVTGTLSGNEIGLADVSSHLHALAINWGVSIFAVNAATWAAIAEDNRTMIAEGIRALEQRVWQSAESDTQMGLWCNTGETSCKGAPAKAMKLVPATAADTAALRRVLVQSVLPRWAARCGAQCITAWNETMQETTSIRLGESGQSVAADLAR
jgi:TRAP-type C4-dicarboxylate transport system substrate-binding protein